MQYAILIYGTEGVYDRLPREEQDQVMGKHRALQEEHGARGSLGPVARLMETSTAMTVRKSGDNIMVLDGPFAETKEQLLGLYIIECESMADAVEQAKKLPLNIACCEVRPIAWAGGNTLALAE